MKEGAVVANFPILFYVFTYLFCFSVATISGCHSINGPLLRGYSMFLLKTSVLEVNRLLPPGECCETVTIVLERERLDC